jgi:hypothetical protein
MEESKSWIFDLEFCESTVGVKRGEEEASVEEGAEGWGTGTFSLLSRRSPPLSMIFI